jgi:hypothetical protein
MWKIDPKINIYIRTSIIIHKFRCSMFEAVELLCGTQGKRERKRK